MIKIEEVKNDLKLICKAIQIGNDWNVSIYGGDIPHIGAVAIGIPRISLENTNKISSSVSLITVTGHKEDIIVQKVCSNLTKNLNSITVVSCGIHIKNIKTNDFNTINELIIKITEKLISKIKFKNCSI